MIHHQYVGVTGKEVFVCSYIVNLDAPTLLIVPNLGWYHVGPNRLFTQIANLCLKQGINTVVFDYFGEGESSGNCRDLTLELLQYSLLSVYEYVKKNFRSKLFGMGIGVGNHLIQHFKELISWDGIVLYQPEFEIFQQFKEIFSKDEIEQADKTGYFDIIKDKSKKSVFWRSIVGHYHDCTYNPISTRLVMELVEQFKIPMSVSCLDGNMLIIVPNDVVVDSSQVEVYVVKEFADNIIPEDWNKKANLWPTIIEKINYYITEWLVQQLKVMSILEMQRSEQTKRTIVSFTSGEEDLHAVLHSPFQKKGKMPCVIFIPGLGGDKVDNFLCGPRFGDMLAQQGVSMFRYNNRYSGSSINELSGYTWSKIIQDFHQAFEALSRMNNQIDFEKVFLVAWSEGAKLATYIANQFEGLRGVYFWNPVLDDTQTKVRLGASNDTKSMVPRFIKNQKGQVVTQLGGEFLGIEYFEDHQQYDFGNLFSQICIPTKILWGSIDVSSAAYSFVMQKFNNQIIEAEILKTDHHLFDYDLLDVVHQNTYDWIESILLSDLISFQ